MKPLLFRLFIVIVLFSNPYFCLAQSIFGKVTPQTSGFIKYGITPVSYYSGKINVEIPIYTLQDPDFPFPISLSYTSDGFKPSKHSGFAGLDWVLNYGGVITREIYGAPDDANGSHGSDPRTSVGMIAKGFWYAMKERKHSASELWNFSTVECNNIYCDLPKADSYWYDCQPDLFLFRFPGGSGSFMIDNDGGVKSSIPGLKVDLTDFTKQSEQALEVLPSTIVITDLNGYKYTFGSSVSAMEYQRVVRPGYNLSFIEQHPAVMAWYLVKVQAPNGRVLTISYDSRLGYPANSSFWQASSTTTDQFPPCEYKCSAIKGVFPQKITIPDTNVSIEFMKSIETCERFYGFIDYNYPSFQLHTINVMYDNKPLYTYRLEYENVQHLRFLKKVYMPDSGVYELTYSHCSYPKPDIKDVDFWGYWSSKISDIVIRPDLPFFPTEPLAATLGSSINVSGSGFAPSLLWKIIYPTGGSTEYSYERHHYNKRVDVRSNNGFVPIIAPKEGFAGGYRVTKISDKVDDKSVAICRTISYDKATGKETGILNQYPPYSIADGESDDKAVYVMHDVWFQNYNIEDNHIGYSAVRETFDDGSYINYHFSDYHSNPDRLDSNFRFITSEEGDFKARAAFLTCNWVSSSSQERGRLLEKGYFNSNGEYVKRESYSYRGVKGLGTTVPTLPITPFMVSEESDYVVSLVSFAQGVIAKKVRLKSFPLVESVLRTYDSSPQDIFEFQKKSCEYNRFDQLTKTTEENSDGSRFERTFTYPEALQRPLIPQNIYTQMVRRNIINAPVKEESYLNGKRLFSNHTTFRLNNNQIVKDSVWSAKGSNPSEFFVTYPIYDKYGNALLEVARDGVYTLRLWGYKHQYLIAEIRNFRELDVQTILDIINPAVLEEQSVPDFSFVSRLRNSFPRLHIYLYVYSPLVGVTSVTAPNGTMTNFQYDSAGRLITILDDQNKAVNHYNYQYRFNPKPNF